jgi:hypothetical protein
VRRAEEGKMLDGNLVPVVAFGVMGAMWVIIIYGSTFFGPKT